MLNDKQRCIRVLPLAAYRGLTKKGLTVQFGPQNANPGKITYGQQVADTNYCLIVWRSDL
jgi:hypothetical protein